MFMTFSHPCDTPFACVDPLRPTERTDATEIRANGVAAERPTRHEFAVARLESPRSLIFSTAVLSSSLSSPLYPSAFVSPANPESLLTAIPDDIAAYLLFCVVADRNSSLFFFLRPDGTHRRRGVDLAREIVPFYNLPRLLLRSRDR